MHLLIHIFPASKLTRENVAADQDRSPKPVLNLRFHFQTNEIVPANIYYRGKQKI